MILVPLTFNEILARLEVDVGKRNRARCPIHKGNNPTSLGWNEEKGVFHCFSCGARGDKIDLVILTLEVGFPAAMDWLGIPPETAQSGCPSDPKTNRERRLTRGLERECDRVGQRLRDERYFRFRIGMHALEMGRLNPEDDLAWKLAEIAFKATPLDELDNWLDLLDIGTTEQRLAAWALWRRMEEN